MKLILLFALLLAELEGVAQDVKLAKNGLPKDAKMILLTSNESTDNLYKATARALFERGYSIKSSDPSLGIIQTGHKQVKGGWWLQVLVSVEGNSVKFKGRAAGQRYGGKELANSGSNRYIFAFEDLNELAKSIPHTKIEYLQ